MADVPYNILLQRVGQLERVFYLQKEENAALKAEVERLTKSVELYRAHRCPNPIDELQELRAEVQRLQADRSIRDAEADGRRIERLVHDLADRDAEVERLRDALRELLQASERSTEFYFFDGHHTWEMLKRAIAKARKTVWTHDGNNWSQDVPKQEDDDGN